MDRPHAITCEKELCRVLALGMFNNKKIVPCIAKASANFHQMVDDRFERGLTWIISRVEETYGDLHIRVSRDRQEKKARQANAWAAQKCRVAAFKEVIHVSRSWIYLHVSRQTTNDGVHVDVSI